MLKQTPPPAQVATLRAGGGALVPVVSTRTRGGKHRHTRTDSAPLPMRLHRTFRSRVERGTATSFEGRSLASATEATNRRCSVSLEEPGAHVEHERRATPRGMSPAGHLKGDRRLLHRRQRRPLRFDRLGDGLTALALRLATPARLEGSPRALFGVRRLQLLSEACPLQRGLKGYHARYSTRYALTACTNQYRFQLVLFGVRRLQLLSEACPLQRG